LLYPTELQARKEKWVEVLTAEPETGWKRRHAKHDT